MKPGKFRFPKRARPVCREKTDLGYDLDGAGSVGGCPNGGIPGSGSPQLAFFDFASKVMPQGKSGYDAAGD